MEVTILGGSGFIGTQLSERLLTSNKASLRIFDKVESLKFITKLRSEQEPIINKCIDTIKKDGGGIISLPCGFGKTCCALYIACQLGLKTLVVVHKSFLQNK